MAHSTTVLEPILERIVRVQPTKPRLQRTTTCLSIADTSTATFGAANALWVFDAPVHKTTSPTVLSIESLACTLSYYPHLAGRLDLTPYPEQGVGNVPHTHRFCRANVHYGSPAEDPGVEVQFARLETEASQVFPDKQARASTHKTWYMPSQTPLDEVFNPIGTMPTTFDAFGLDLPCVKVRVTTLLCGALAIAVKMAHPLADAQTLIQFIKGWGEMHRAMLHGTALPTLTVVFEPGMLDARASGDIDGSKPDPALIDESFSLPLPRYDWWAHQKGNPARMDANLQVLIPDSLPWELVEGRRRGRRIPWEEWDLTLPVQHNIFRLTAQDVNGLYDLAQQHLPDLSSLISRHDVLVAFVWQLVALAKPPASWSGSPSASSRDDISLNVTMGLRTRLNLPASFVGSPLLLAGMSTQYATVTGHAAGKPTSGDFPNARALANASSLLRRHMNRFDSSALGSWLHEQAFELAPHRWWNGFLGSRHTFVTSWVRSGVWDVDFGFASDLRWAGAIGPNLDGLTVISRS